MPPRLLIWLQRALAHEWAAAMQFAAQAARARALGHVRYADFSQQAARDELAHAQQLADTLAAAGREPQPATTPAFRTGSDLQDMLRCARDTESSAIALYAAARRQAAGGTLAELFDQLERDEREHLRTLERWPLAERA
jgi:bacterioferritin (cytochrome b1)